MRDYYYFYVSGFLKPIGCVHVSVVEAVSWPWYWEINRRSRTLTMTKGNTPEERTQLMRDTMLQASRGGRVPRLCRWHNEVGPVYACSKEHVMDMDFSGTGIFGVVGFGVMLTGWTMKSEQRKYWVPRRSMKKTSYPGMLDNLVSGTLRPNERPIDCMVREISEETGLSEDYTRQKLIACGTVTYHVTKNSDGTPCAQPQVQYVYEIEIEPPQTPAPNDGEVECFNLMSAEEVQEALAKDMFKPNTGMTWLAHFVRHGYINAENEANLIDIESRLHRRHEYFVV